MFIDQKDIIPLARGCAVLGTGGGGNTYSASLRVRQAIDEFGPVPLIDLADLPDDGIILSVGMIGAPSVGMEKLQSGTEVLFLVKEVERQIGAKVSALMPSEIGGANGLNPIAWAARTQLPILDADTVGRAFPELQMASTNVVGLQPELIVLTDERKNTVMVRPSSGDWAETIARAVAVVFGGSATMADYILTTAQARDSVITGSVSRALSIGRAVDQTVLHPVDGLIDELDATRLIEGKVVDVNRQIIGGFLRGSILVEGYGRDTGRLVRIEVQNENLVAIEDGRVLASVPDLITVVDSQTADAISSETIRYGQRVSVIAFDCHELWRTRAGIAVAGPRAFGYDFDYVSLEENNAIA